MMIEVKALIECGIAPTQARLFADPLSAAFVRYRIFAPIHRAAFLAQAMHESVNLTRMEEGLFYRDPARIRAVWPTRFKTTAEALPFARNPQGLANKVYGGRMGNVNPGDGWRFRGRGIFQLTGCDNYRAASDALGTDFVLDPDKVGQPEAAALTAAWFWNSRNCSEKLDTLGFDAVTRAINGGTHGAKERAALFKECLEALE